MDISLNLSSQNLTEVPDSVLNETQMEKLLLDFNDLTVLPSLFCQKLKFLSCLSLNGNFLKELPLDISMMTQLTELYLRENDLYTLPESIGSLEKLQRFHVTGNHLKELPNSISFLKNLTELIADENEIEGLPQELGNLNALSYLDLSCNSIEFLPPDFGSLKHLKYLNLSNNSLRYLPNSFQNLPSVEIIDLTNNHISELPDKFLSSKILKKFVMTNNRIVLLPAWFSELENVTEIYLRCNCLQQMPFPENFGNNCINLELLDLSGNNITSLPSDFGKLKKLKILDIGSPEDELERNRFLANGNSLSFLPFSFPDLKNLTKLELDENKILELPNDFGHLSNLIYLDLSHNILKILPKSFCELQNMKVCMLSMNYLTCLPDNFGLLSSLEDLKLDNNMLVELPDTFENLSNLLALDLYSNKLKEIPKALKTFTCLKHLDMRENDFDLTFDKIPEVSCEPTYPVRNPKLAENWRGRKRHDIQPCSWVEQKDVENHTERFEDDILLNALNSSSSLWRRHGQDNIRKPAAESENMHREVSSQNSMCELSQTSKSSNDDLAIKLENENVLEGYVNEDCEYWDENGFQIPLADSPSSLAEKKNSNSPLDSSSLSDDEIESSCGSYKKASDKGSNSGDSSDWETDNIYFSKQVARCYTYPTECEHSDSCPHFIPSKIQAHRILPVEFWYPVEEGQFDDNED